jgi:hypothetical protein
LWNRRMGSISAMVYLQKKVILRGLQCRRCSIRA